MASSSGRSRFAAPPISILAVTLPIFMLLGFALWAQVSGCNWSWTTTFEPPKCEAAPLAAGTSPESGVTSAGIPDGVGLTESGPLTVDKPGAVVMGLEITGPLRIVADDVTIRQTRVTASASAVISVQEGVRGARIEDVEVDGMSLKGQEGSSGVEGPATVIRARISGVENGIKPGDGSTIADSVISNLLAPGSDPHYDGIEIDGGSDIVIRGNTIDMHEWSQTSCVMIDNYFAPVARVQVVGNQLLGAGYTVYSDGRFDGGPIRDVAFVGNRLGKGQWGYASVSNSRPSWSDNVDIVSGEDIEFP